MSAQDEISKRLLGMLETAMNGLAYYADNEHLDDTDTSAHATRVLNELGEQVSAFTSTETPKKCQDKYHFAPTHLWVAPGSTSKWVCPSCGSTQIITGPEYTL